MLREGKTPSDSSLAAIAALRDGDRPPYAARPQRRRHETGQRPEQAQTETGGWQPNPAQARRRARAASHRPGPAPVLGGFFAPTQLKIQTLARSPAATTTWPCALTLSDSAWHQVASTSCKS